MLSLKNKIHRQHQEHEPNKVIHPERLIFEEDERENDKDHQRDHLLDDFELNQGERSAKFAKADAVGRDLKHVLKQCDTPTDEDDTHQAEVLAPGHLLEAEVTVPGESHEGVGESEKGYGNQGFRHQIMHLVEVYATS